MKMTKLWITTIVQIILLMPASSGQQLDCGLGGEAVERSEHTLTCGGLQAGGTVQWTKKDQNSVTNAVASCAGSGPCLNNYPSKYEVTRASGTTSILKILQVTRDLSFIGGDWTCTALSSSTCSITVIYPPDHDGCEVRFDETSGKVLGQCVLHKIYPSPTCTWSEQFQGSQWIQIPHNQTTLSETQFVDSSNSQVYIRATCQLHRPLPATVGSYSYKVLVIPGHVEPVVNFTSTNTIRLPVSPSLTSSCPSDYVTDARIASCPCVTSDLGSPPARLAWLDPDGRSVVSASTLTLALTFSDITAVYNGGAYHCEVQHHTGSSRVPYFPKIAVRPNKPTVRDHNNNTAFSPGQTTTLQCAADGGRPAITQLVLQCPGQPDAPGRLEGGMMISSLTLTLAVSHDGTFCTCVADNGYLSSESGIFVLQVSDGGGGLSQTTIIIIAVVCCIVLLSVIVAVVVIYLRNKGSPDSYSKIKPDRSVPAQRNAAVQQGAPVSNPVYDHAGTEERQSSENHYDSPVRVHAEEEKEYEHFKKTAGSRKAEAKPTSPQRAATATGIAAEGNKKTGGTRRETPTVVPHNDTMEGKIKQTKAPETSDKSDRRSPLSTRRSPEQDKSEQSECASGLIDDEEQIPDDKIPDMSESTASAQDFGAHEQDERDARNRKVRKARPCADSKHVKPPTAYPEQSDSPVQDFGSYLPSARSAHVVDIEEDNKHSEQGINTDRSRKIGKQTQGTKGPRPMVYPQNRQMFAGQSFSPPADDSGGSMARAGRQRPKSGAARQHEALTIAASSQKETDENDTSHPISPRPLPNPPSSFQQDVPSKREVKQFLDSVFKPDGENEHPLTEGVIKDSTAHDSTGRRGRRSSDAAGGIHTISGAGRRAEEEGSWSVHNGKPRRSRSLYNIHESHLSPLQVSEAVNI